MEREKKWKIFCVKERKACVKNGYMERRNHTLRSSKEVRWLVCISQTGFSWCESLLGPFDLFCFRSIVNISSFFLFFFHFFSVPFLVSLSIFFHYVLSKFIFFNFSLHFFNFGSSKFSLFIFSPSLSLYFLILVP